ncbi:LOW QUALITY PROTEIN: intestinal mucin-like protein [Hippoglossus hippoglossus]|uniref:LOW QUALITY PROTEIN: intestinal mucin-like protein n=1 Tax=Hippoglossus hippoglossus TaxID=8267 RepID=UPI00148D082B|nr:LOW QUALITY PROTEIN: intestinal mucin-like protein [Hippoglossus hippoglossus]
MVYNVTDGNGWCYYGYCNASCKIEARSMPCATTTLPTTTPGLSTPTTATLSTSTSPPSTTTPSTTPSTTTLDCTDVYPTRKNGDTWDVGNCTTAECINGVVKTKPTSCSTVQKPICANGRKPVKMDNKDGCCFHYECECVCSVWSGTHYMTFDGKTYDFNKNCTYYLVKEMINKNNLTITVNNHVCEPSEDTFCPQDLTVMYQSYKVVFTQIKTSESTVNAVYLNDERIYPAYKNSDLLFTSTDMAVTLEIPGISTEVVYRGSSITIELAASLFEGNTEGQCGTCDNSRNNDCRSPNGQVESCSDSADQWHVPNKPCTGPLTTTVPPVTTPQTTTQPPCNSAICELLKSSVFDPCHSVIPPGSYVKTCISDICINGNNTCTSLEAYAAECSNAGVCINWRNATNGQCEHKCPSNQVYKACGPKVEPTCNERYNEKFDASKTASTNSSQEGCFCTDGTTVFNTVYGTCVAYCYCVGPDGGPKQVRTLPKTDIYVL